MHTLIQEIEKAALRSDLPNFRPGDTVKVHVRITEGKVSRIQLFEGVVIRRQGGGARETFTVRKVSKGGYGVERTFPLNLPPSRSSRSRSAATSAAPSSTTSATCEARPPASRRSATSSRPQLHRLLPYRPGGSSPTRTRPSLFPCLSGSRPHPYHSRYENVPRAPDLVTIGRAARRAERTPWVAAVFKAHQVAAVLDLLELLEYAWHDCYGEITPEDSVIKDVLTISQGDLVKLTRAALLAVVDSRDLRMAADALTTERDRRKAGRATPGRLGPVAIGEMRDFSVA